MFFALFFLVALSQVASGALIPRQTPCSFVMNAVGYLSGSVVQDKVGENRIGGTYPQGTYYIADGDLIDSLHHNCIIYASSSQFQCTNGVSGGTKYSLDDDDNLLHDGIASWLACPALGPGNDGSYNIFSNAKANTTGCQAITLRAGGFNCTALGGSSSSSASVATRAVTSTFSATTSSTSPAACPTDISGGIFQFPHLIVPTSPQAPDHSFGNSYKAYISPINTTLFNFDIPSTALYKDTCALLFLFPYASDEDPSAGGYYFSGTEEEEGEHGGLDFALLVEVANANTTYDTTGVVAKDFGTTQILPGNNYTVATFDCQAGATVTYMVSSKGNVELDYFQDSLPSPIGLYIVPCGSA